MAQSAEAEIRRRIAWQGKITFAEFMELALYHPEGGYYANPSPFGRAGDYFTSPAAHPAFGALKAVQLQRMWELVGCPRRFYAVEMGAGTGLLARDIVDHAGRLHGAFAEALCYTALDRYAAAGDAQASPNGIQRLIAAGAPLRGVVGCIISNELLDSFPVHRFRVHDGAVKEVYVALDEEGGFTDELADPSTPELVGRIDSLGLSLSEGFRGEVNLSIRPWMRQVSDALEKGFVMTIDYGYLAQELYSSTRAGGTLQTYYRHTQGSGPYHRVGQQDITAHVDFSLVVSEGEALGLRPLALLSQSRFLRNLGFEDMHQRLREMTLSQRERNANSMAMLELVKPDGLGAFKVLVQERATGVGDPAQLTPCVDLASKAAVPLLSPAHMPLMMGRYPHLAWNFEELWPGDESQ